MERNEISRKVEMGTSDIGRRESRRQMTTDDDGGSSAALTAWKIVGGTVLALAVVTLVVTLPDIKRYIKISTM
jgi:hypothetical protein